MAFTQVYLVSDVLETVADSEVKAAEAKLNTTFPAGYTEYVTTLGRGTYSGYVRVYLPDQILSEHSKVQARWKEHYFWDQGDTDMDRQRVLESMILGDTTAGDELIFHPQRPNAIYVLPHEEEEVYQAGANLEAAIDWLCHSGTLTEPLSFEYFESWKDRAEIKLDASDQHTLEEIKDLIQGLKMHDHIEENEDDGLLNVFVKDFGGQVVCFIDPDTASQITIYHDRDKHTAALTTLVDTLKAAGFGERDAD